MSAASRVVGILQARVGSTRLPGKVLLPAVGTPLIVHMIQRVRRAATLSALWLATSASPENDPLAALGSELGVPVFRGSEDDVLSRFAEIAERASADVVVRLTGDCPLHDPGVIDEVVRHFLRADADYVSNSLVPTYPDGLDVEVFSRTALDRAHREAQTPLQREHVTPYIHRFHDGPGPFRVEHHRGPADFSHLRWTVDEPADYEFVRQVFEALHPANPAFGWLDVVALVTRKPALLGQSSGIPRNQRYLAELGRQPR
jgi:spore coat polysaccharide biosynthesis protein SpsF (cytidylyltransferase family)